MITTSESVRDAFHYLYPDELPALKQLAQLLPDNPLVINIGAGSGTSGLAFLESRPDLVLITIDIQENDSPLGCLYAERQVVEAAGYGSTWQKRWFQIHSDSKVVAQNWSKVSAAKEWRGEPSVMYFFNHVDMVFIDGDHSYEGCAGDIRAWLPNVKLGGILAVHDYNKQILAPNPRGPHPRPWVSVNQAVDELLVGHYETILYVDSLIAFRVGEQDGTT